MNAITLSKKRKNIDLTEDTIKRLSVLAAAQGNSLKAYIENVLTAKANSVEMPVSESPSPSNDPWFDNKENMEMLKEAIGQAQKGAARQFSVEDIKSTLGL